MNQKYIQTDINGEQRTRSNQKESFILIVPNEDLNLRTPSETSYVVYEKNKICYSYCQMGRSEEHETQEREGL